MSDTQPQNPCGGFSASDLDYSKNKQHIIDDHLAWFQLKPAPSMTSSQYMFEGVIKSVSQAWTLIVAFNANSFENPETISQVGNAYRFTSLYPPHPPAAYTGFERKKIPILFGIPFYNTSRTMYNTVVVNTDCKTVETSYPGKP